MSKEQEPKSVFDVLGSEIARQVLTLANLKPLSATELVEYCEVSGSAIYRRIHVLQGYDMLDGQLEFDDEGRHYKRLRTGSKEARFQVDEGQFDIDTQLKRDYSDKFSDLWNGLEKGTKEISDNTTADSRRHDSSSSDLNGG